MILRLHICLIFCLLGSAGFCSVQMSTTLSDVHNRGAVELAGSITWSVNGGDFRDASAEHPVYIRVTLDHNAFLFPTVLSCAVGGNFFVTDWQDGALVRVRVAEPNAGFGEIDPIFFPFWSGSAVLPVLPVPWGNWLPPVKPPPSEPVVDLGDGTVVDYLSGLIRKKTAACAGLSTWQDALSFANNLADGTCGLSDGSSPGDWRLPNLNERHSLIDLGGVPASVSWTNAEIEVATSLQTRQVWAVRSMAVPLRAK